MTYATSKTSPQKNSNDDSKNQERVLRRSGNPQQQIQLKDVIEFIQKTMVTLSYSGKKVTRLIFLRNNPSRNVINLSKNSFIKGQYNLLNKNLNFCPKPGYSNKEELKRDVKSFTRKIKLREQFYDNKENHQVNQVVSEPVIECKSNWEPVKNHHTVETFVEALENNV